MTKKSKNRWGWTEAYTKAQEIKIERDSFFAAGWIPKAETGATA